jgi:hypothetical protein
MTAQVMCCSRSLSVLLGAKVATKSRIAVTAAVRGIHISTTAVTSHGSHLYNATLTVGQSSENSKVHCFVGGITCAERNLVLAVRSFQSV